jgi:hypothetical protein
MNTFQFKTTSMKQTYRVVFNYNFQWYFVKIVSIYGFLNTKISSVNPHFVRLYLSYSQSCKTSAVVS